MHKTKLLVEIMGKIGIIKINQALMKAQNH